MPASFMNLALAFLAQFVQLDDFIIKNIFRQPCLDHGIDQIIIIQIFNDDSDPSSSHIAECPERVS